MARGRERLRARLVRRGVVPTTAAAAGLALAREARAVVRPALAEATARLALRFAAGRGTAGMLVSPAEWLARLDHRRLLMARLRTMTMALATTGVLAAGATLLGQFAAPVPGSAPAGAEAKAGALQAKTYPVADLLVGSIHDDGDQPKYHMTPLIELLTSSVAPGTWRVSNEDGRLDRDEGGTGSIIPFRPSLSLIVRHTPEVHAQFAERLAQLRLVLGTYQANTAMNAVPSLPPGGAPRAPGMMPGAMGMAGPSAAPGALPPAGMMMPGMPGMPAGFTPVVSAVPPGANQPRAAGLRPGGMAHTVPVRPDSDGQPVPHGAYSGARPGGQPAYDASIAYSPSALPKDATRWEPPREAETERRLRSLEDKLDRVLKALDASKPDAPPAGPHP